MKKEKQRFYIEFKVEGGDRVQKTNTVSTSEAGAKQKVRSMFGKGVKVQFLEVTNYDNLS